MRFLTFPEQATSMVVVVATAKVEVGTNVRVVEPK